MTELKKLFEEWLESTIDSSEEKEILEIINRHIGETLSEKDQEEIKSRIFQYATCCQWNSFAGGFRKASLLWQESTFWKLDAEKTDHTTQLLKSSNFIEDLQEIQVDSRYELTSCDLEELYKYSHDKLKLIRNSFLYGYKQGKKAKSAELKTYMKESIDI